MVQKLRKIPDVYEYDLGHLSGPSMGIVMVDLIQLYNDNIVDPKLASYGVENPIYAVIQLAQTTMRSELGKITLDKTFEERDTLNEKRLW
ncbi:hypothetical protein JHK87_010940 [Glycine soja]|nr:hypothetical protein JHK87_010940 [Glycine soja]